MCGSNFYETDVMKTVLLNKWRLSPLGHTLLLMRKIEIIRCRPPPLILSILKAFSEAAAVDAMDGLPFPVTVPGEANES